MILTNKALARRAFLRGLGTAVALPFLDAMAPAFGAPARNALKPLTRMAFLYVPNGIIMKDWTPADEGAGFVFSKTLQPIEQYRDNVLILSNLDHHNGQSLGDGAGDHARAGATWLTGVHPRKTQGADIQAGISADQIAANAIGRETALPSLQLGIDDGRMVGNCDSGYSCAYSNTISWSSPTQPLPLETNPRALFERLFGDGDTTDPAVRAREARLDRSILDFVSADASRLSLDLGAHDRRKLSEYLDSVREIEMRIQRAEKEQDSHRLIPTIDRPSGVPPTFEEHVQLMFDLMTVAFQTDQTRIITMMIGREGSNRTYPAIGVPDAHHGLSHHFNDPSKIERLQRIDSHHIELFGYFLGKLQSARDGEGTLLDHSMIVYGSSLSDGNRHLHDHLPTLFAGGGSGKIRGGRHIRYPQNTPMTDLFMSMLDNVGVHPERIGDSDGKVDHLTDLS